MIGTCVVGLAFIFVVFERNNIDPGLAGLALSSALNLVRVLNLVVLTSNETENEMVSVERIVRFSI